MKALSLVVALFVSSNAFACLGGKAELANGSVVLTAESASAPNFSESTVEMLEEEMSFSMKEDGKQKTVSVVHVQKDAGGVIYTVYEIKDAKKTSSAEPTYIKVESNYKGNGVRTRGAAIEPEFEISETFGC